MNKYFLLFICLFVCALLNAQEQETPTGSHYDTVSIDGLMYTLNEKTHTAMVVNDNKWVGNLEIPEEVSYNDQKYVVDRLEWLAFQNCETLIRVRIPKTVTDIHHYAGNFLCKNPFDGCTSLERIEVDEENPSMCSIDGVLFSKDKTWLYCYPAGAGRDSYDVPESVTSFGMCAFSGSSHLVNVTIPNSVTYLASGIFNKCSSLKSVRLSESISYIEAYTFDHCESLQYLDIPENVSGFAEGVFRWTALKCLVIRGTFPQGLCDDTFLCMDKERTVIYCQPSEIEKFKKVYKGTVLPLEEFLAGITAPVPAPSVVPHDFDLQGRSVNGTSRPGIYIQQGRKRVVK